ncbi:aldose 1-epimerase [Maribacter sp. 2307ULW6-5]|uniref:aldose epimerase family protein n=1 Tax=Maribacter sp. 2307ULW6-5 TaxID=3386275 RepID=UPI0039BC9C24
MTILKHKDQTVRIDGGELVGYAVDGHEFIHQKGSPGWRSSDTEMFPIIGPTDTANFRVATPRGHAVQDQHGLLLEMPYQKVEENDLCAAFVKEYAANTPVANAKYPGKSTEAQLQWPYDFSFTKRFLLKDQGLSISFEIQGEEGMPFMLGYHPAFKVHSDSATIRTNNQQLTLAQVMAVGSRAMPILDQNSILLEDTRTLEVRTTGFPHFMLWTEVPNMVCMEPITFYPYAVPQAKLHQGFQTLGKDRRHYSVLLTAH